MANGVVILARWIHFVSATILFGSALFALYGTRPAKPSAQPLLPRSVQTALAFLALLSGLAWLAGFAMELAEEDGLWVTVRSVLLETGFGPVWLVRLAAAFLLTAAAVADAPPSLLALFSALLLGVEGWSGHAATGTLGSSLIQAVHVVAAATWLGGLVPLAILVANARRGSEAAIILALRRFSTMGTVAVAVIFATGLVNTWRILGGIPSPAHAYGRVLLLKIGLFALMLGLAGLNRFWLVERLGGVRPGPELLWLRWTIVGEQIIGVGVLLDVSVLGTMNPHP